MAIAFTNASATSNHLYIHGSTGGTATTTNTVPDDGTYWVDDRPPHRIMQRQPLPAMPMIDSKSLLGIPNHDKNLIDATFDMKDVKILEIPYHRIYRGMKHFEVPENTLLELPDGTFIDIEDRHHYTIHDAKTQVAREHCTIRAFNRFLNASELLEAFIKDMAPSGIRQDQVLKVPIEAFINWLIFQAAKEDGDDIPDEYYNHRCIYCKRFIAKKLVIMGVNFCNARHLDGYLNRTKLLENNRRLSA